jgi:hypothetical protein
VLTAPAISWYRSSSILAAAPSGTTARASALVGVAPAGATGHHQATCDASHTETPITHAENSDIKQSRRQGGPTHGVAVAEGVVGRDLPKDEGVGDHGPEEIHGVNLQQRLPKNTMVMRWIWRTGCAVRSEGSKGTQVRPSRAKMQPGSRSAAHQLVPGWRGIQHSGVVRLLQSQQHRGSSSCTSASHTLGRQELAAQPLQHCVQAGSAHLAAAAAAAHLGRGKHCQVAGREQLGGHTLSLPPVVPLHGLKVQVRGKPGHEGPVDPVLQLP